MKFFSLAAIAGLASAQMTMTLPQAQLLVNKYDRNGDGELEWNEFRVMVRAHLHGRRMTAGQWGFVHRSFNAASGADHTLTAAELATMH